MSDVSDMPPIEEASVEPSPAQRMPRHATDGGAPRGGGPNHAPRGGRMGEGVVQRGPRYPQGGGDGGYQHQCRPTVVPGQIEAPTRTNVFVPPSCIFFTQRSIPSHFADGKSLQETFDLIAKREMRKRDLPIIDVFWKEGAYWTLSNRRLALFSELERRKFAKQVKIKIIPFDESAHATYEPFFAFWRENPTSRPWPGGMPEGWGGDEPIFNPSLAGDITVVEKSTPMETDVNHNVKHDVKPDIKPVPCAKSIPPLVKMSSSEDEGLAGRDVKPQTAASTPTPTDPKRSRNSIMNRFSSAENKGVKRPSTVGAISVVSDDKSAGVNGQSCMCNNVVNVFNRAKGGVAKPLSEFFLKNPRPNKYVGDLKKPPELNGFICGCGHAESTLAALGKHKDRTGHACWNNNTYDSLRDLILNEDLRISCGGAIL